MRQRSKSSRLDNDIADVLRRKARGSRSAHAVTKASLRDLFVEALTALRSGFSTADEVVARVYNEAERRGGDQKALAKLKTLANRMDKAIQRYGEEVDDLIARLE